jgi:hypothetical protein
VQKLPQVPQQFTQDEIMEKLLKQVDKAPNVLKDTGAGNLTNMLPVNPLTDGMSGMITSQLMSPPTVYYLIGFAVFLFFILGCIIYLLVKVRSIGNALNNPTNTVQPQPQQLIQSQVQPQAQVVGYDQNTGQPIMSQVNSQPAQTVQPQQVNVQQFQSGMFWPNGRQLSQKDIEKEQKPLRKRGIIHLLRTLFMVLSDPYSLQKIRTGAYNPALNRVAPQFQQIQQPVYQPPVQQVAQQIPQQIPQQVQTFSQQMPQQIQQIPQQLYGDPRLQNNVNPQSNVIPMPTNYVQR